MELTRLLGAGGNSGLGRLTFLSEPSFLCVDDGVLFSDLRLRQCQLVRVKARRVLHCHEVSINAIVGSHQTPVLGFK
ncbi:hypothetical protein JG688_00017732 [Phytophthora aleatoria]|uniref:Uncharacterized protein n=1 Tax=Phytophthora aleatoria TaxID=2496075 RepID=A0A8J5IC07_9STRA|nr:hypothetical protein JG688_00017732 [Phytophthora aleatoria]